MFIEERHRGGITILRLSGRITFEGGDRMLREAFGNLLEDGHRNFVFEMEDVPYLDSSGIGEVVACHDRARKQEGVIRLVLNERLSRLFSLYQLERVFKIFRDTEDALASFSSPAFELVH